MKKWRVKCFPFGIWNAADWLITRTAVYSARVCTLWNNPPLKAIRLTRFQRLGGRRPSKCPTPLHIFTSSASSWFRRGEERPLQFLRMQVRERSGIRDVWKSDAGKNGRMMADGGDEWENERRSTCRFQSLKLEGQERVWFIHPNQPLEISIDSASFLSTYLLAQIPELISSSPTIHGASASSTIIEDQRKSKLKPSIPLWCLPHTSIPTNQIRIKRIYGKCVCMRCGHLSVRHDSRESW